MRRYLKSLIIFGLVLLNQTGVLAQSLECPHCLHQRRYDDVELQNQDLPKGMYNRDSTIGFFPVIDDLDCSKLRMSTLKVFYVDGHYCSGRTSVKFELSDTTFTLNSTQDLSCKIVSWLNIPDNVHKKLKKSEIQKIVITNLSTYHEFTWIPDNKKYFIELLKSK